MLAEAGLLARFSLLVGLLPLGFGVAYAIRPTEQRLALLRPISLAAIFAGLAGAVAGGINVLRMFWLNPATEGHVIAVGSAESLVPLLVAFSSLTIAWLCAAFGLRRHA